MPLQQAAAREAQRILELARHDRVAARELLGALCVEEQVTLVCELPVAARSRLLDLLPAPEQVIPALPEAELVFTAKAIGLGDAGWILEHASDSQVQACFDLDAWHDDTLDPAALARWFDALADAGSETLTRGARAIDAEILYLYLRSRIGAYLKPNDDSWSAAEGDQTLEGQFYFRALNDGDDLETVVQLLRGLFEEDYWLYFRMLQALTWEDPNENEEFALRWRVGRLGDLGFPTWEESMRIYGFLRPEQRLALPAKAEALSVEGWQLPVWMPHLPVAIDARHLVFRAAAALDDDERRAFFFGFIALANQVAVADRMALGDAESIPAAIEKAATLTSRGLELLTNHHRVDSVSMLRHVPVTRLFRIGASLDRAERRPAGSSR
jgi:hypothetical protein